MEGEGVGVCSVFAVPSSTRGGAPFVPVRDLVFLGIPVDSVRSMVLIFGKWILAGDSGEFRLRAGDCRVRFTVATHPCAAKPKDGAPGDDGWMGKLRPGERGYLFPLFLTSADRHKGGNFHRSQALRV